MKGLMGTGKLLMPEEVLMFELGQSLSHRLQRVLRRCIFMNPVLVLWRASAGDKWGSRLEAGAAPATVRGKLNAGLSHWELPRAGGAWEGTAPVQHADRFP